MWIGALVPAALPAAAQDDVTPPTLHSLVVTPNLIDTSAGEQVVIATLTARDDDSGVAAVRIKFLSPSGSHSVGNDAEAQPDETQEVSVVFPEGEEEGIWTLVFVKLWDSAGNAARFNNLGLPNRYVNVAIGNGSIEAFYSRSVATLSVRRVRWRGSLSSEVLACQRDVPIALQRRTNTGWRQLDVRFTNKRGEWRGFVGFQPPGTYRAVAEKSQLGDPTLAVCGRDVGRETRGLGRLSSRDIRRHE